MPSIFRELHIERCRHVANYGNTGISAVARSIWAYYYKYKGLRMPDTFCSFSEYYNDCTLPQGETIELMCHPGHHCETYQKEYEELKNANMKIWNAKLISYKDI